jgi:predicted lipid-binding transport protein (Tim44 family)
MAPSSGFFVFMGVLYGSVGIGMLFAAYWRFESGQSLHVVFSLLMAICGVLASWICFNRARSLRRLTTNASNARPDQSKE